MLALLAWGCFAEFASSLLLVFSVEFLVKFVKS